jgi:hypothetical protein
MRYVFEDSITTSDFSKTLWISSCPEEGFDSPKEEGCCKVD